MTTSEFIGQAYDATLHNRHYTIHQRTEFASCADGSQYANFVVLGDRGARGTFQLHRKADGELRATYINGIFDLDGLSTEVIMAELDRIGLLSGLA